MPAGNMHGSIKCNGDGRPKRRSSTTDAFEDAANITVPARQSIADMMAELDADPPTKHATIASQEAPFWVSADERVATPKLQRMHVLQASKNAWTAFALQTVYSQGGGGSTSAAAHAECTPAVFGCSMLHPYVQTYLEDSSVPLKRKVAFQLALQNRILGVPQRQRLNGSSSSRGGVPDFPSGATAFEMVALIEKEHHRQYIPEVFLSIAACNDARTAILVQHNEAATHQPPAALTNFQRSAMANTAPRAQRSKPAHYHSLVLTKTSTVLYEHLLEQTCYKGGASALAHIHTVNGRVSTKEAAFAFAFGFALQMLDDLHHNNDNDNNHHSNDGGGSATSSESSAPSTFPGRPPESTPSGRPPPLHFATLLTVVDADNVHDVAYAEATVRRLATFLDFVCNNCNATDTAAGVAAVRCGGGGLNAAHEKARTVHAGAGSKTRKHSPELEPAPDAFASTTRQQEQAGQLQGVYHSMAMNTLFKSIAKNPNLFSPHFVHEWGPFSPFPPADTAHVPGLWDVCKLALKNML